MLRIRAGQGDPGGLRGSDSGHEPLYAGEAGNIVIQLPLRYRAKKIPVPIIWVRGGYVRNIFLLRVEILIAVILIPVAPYQPGHLFDHAVYLGFEKITDSDTD